MVCSSARRSTTSSAGSASTGGGDSLPARRGNGAATGPGCERRCSPRPAARAGRNRRSSPRPCVASTPPGKPRRSGPPRPTRRRYVGSSAGRPRWSAARTARRTRIRPRRPPAARVPGRLPVGPARLRPHPPMSAAGHKVPPTTPRPLPNEPVGGVRRVVDLHHPADCCLWDRHRQCVDVLGGTKFLLARLDAGWL